MSKVSGSQKHHHNKNISEKQFQSWCFGKKQQSALSTGRTMPPTRASWWLSQDWSGTTYNRWNAFSRLVWNYVQPVEPTPWLVSCGAAIDFDNKARLCVALLDQYCGCIPSEHLFLQIVVSESCPSPILFL